MTKAEAEIAEEQVRKTVILDRKRVNPTTYKAFDKVIEEFLCYRKSTRAETTVEAEENKSKHLTAEFGPKRVDQISVPEIHDWIQRQKKNGWSDRYINLHLTLLRSIHQFAVGQGYATHNPGIEVKDLPQSHIDRPMPPAERITRFIEEARKTRTGFQLVVWLWPSLRSDPASLSSWNGRTSIFNVTRSTSDRAGRAV